MLSLFKSDKDKLEDIRHAIRFAIENFFRAFDHYENFLKRYEIEPHDLSQSEVRKVLKEGREAVSQRMHDVDVLIPQRTKLWYKVDPRGYAKYTSDTVAIERGDDGLEDTEAYADIQFKKASMYFMGLSGSFDGEIIMRPKETSIVHQPRTIRDSIKPELLKPDKFKQQTEAMAHVPSGLPFTKGASDRAAHIARNNESIIRSIANIRELQRKDELASTLQAMTIEVEAKIAENKIMILDGASALGITPESYSKIQEDLIRADIEVAQSKERHKIAMAEFEEKTRLETQAYRERRLIDQEVEKNLIDHTLDTERKKQANEVAAEVEKRTGASRYALNLTQETHRTRLWYIDEIGKLKQALAELPTLRTKKQQSDASRWKMLIDEYNEELNALRRGSFQTDNEG